MQFLNSNVIAISLTAMMFASSDTQSEGASMVQIRTDIRPVETEEGEWAELEESALSSEELDAVAEYLRATGQASA